MPGIFRHPPPIQPNLPAPATFAAPPPFKTIAPTGKPSDFAVGVPTVSLGTIIPVGKPSDFAAGAPFINLFQAIAPTGKPSDFAPGVPSLIPAQTINPTGKPSDFAPGTPYLLGGPQRIVPAGLESGFRAGIPTLTGGTGGVKVFVGGVDATKYINYGVSNPGVTAQTTAQQLTLTSQTLGRWTAVFDWWDPAQTAFPEIDQTVMIQENGVTLFSGGIISVTIDRFDSPKTYNVFHVTCQDWSAICDRRVVNATYQAGYNVAAAINDILTNVLGNPFEGITAGTIYDGGDTFDTTEVFAFKTVTQAFDQIATDTGRVWWIDVNAQLQFLPYANLPTAPLSLTESVHEWRALYGEGTLLDYRNRQYVVSNLASVPGLAQQIAGGGGPGQPGYGGAVTTESYTVNQAAAVARGFLQGAGITNFPILQITKLTVNGVTQPTYLGTAGYNFRHAWWYFPGTPYLIPPNAQNNNTAFPAPPVTSPDPMIGDVVVIQYIPTASSQPAVVQSGSPLVPATPGAAGTWGSGVFENVYQVKNINLQGDLNAVASALLARSGTVPIQVQFETDNGIGTQVGQILPINLPLSFLPSTDTFTITSIQLSLYQGVLQYGSAFRAVIQATTGQDLGNTEKWFERMVARSENALPVQQFDAVTFILDPGASIAAGAITTNPKPSSTAGQFVEAYAQAAVAPTNQNLQIDILQNGVSILGPNNLLVIPAGSTLQVNYSGPFVNATVAIGDQFSLVLTYQPLTGSPLPASSVTVNVRWTTPGLPAGQVQPGVYS